MKIANLVRDIERKFEGGLNQYRGASLEPFLATLSDILQIDKSCTAYMEEFIESNSEQFTCVATLNYDQLVEVALANGGREVDTGLSHWNKKRFVRFHGRSLKLIKLHGSTNWYIRNHDEIIVGSSADNPHLTRAMIFGGQSDKLVPYGPFLHLRHEFQKFLMDSSYLLVIGYSFRDLHLNAIIRSWIATRKNGKIIIVDPGEFAGDPEVFRYSLITRSGRIEGARVEVKQIRKGFSASLPDIQKELDKSPDLSH